MYSLAVCRGHMNGGEEVFYYSLAFAVLITFSAATIFDLWTFKKLNPLPIPVDL
jgi:hypothetical protein